MSYHQHRPSEVASARRQLNVAKEISVGNEGGLTLLSATLLLTVSALPKLILGELIFENGDQTHGASPAL